MTTAAEYYTRKLDNPLTKFLREIPRGVALRDVLMKTPPCPDEEVRAFPLPDRLTLNTLLADLHVALPRDIDLAEEVIQLLTKTYHAREPRPSSVAERKKVATDLAKSFAQGSTPKIEATGRALVGPPGSGKTGTLWNVLSTIPQVVPLDTHTNPLVLSKMVTWVRVEAPSTRKISALVNSLISAILRATGENYKPLLRGSIGIQIERLAMLCQEYYVGLIVIDEIQHVLRKNNEPDIELVNFLVELSNAINVPLFLVGTPKSEFVVASALRQARRSFGPRWSPLPRASQSWKLFSSTVCDYQFTKAVAKYEDLEPSLYDYSQGLPALAVTLFQYAQHAALLIEDETGEPTKITPEIIAAVFSEKMSVVKPMVDALRSRDDFLLSLFDDLKVNRKMLRKHLERRSRTGESTKTESPITVKVSAGIPPLKWRPDAN